MKKKIGLCVVVCIVIILSYLYSNIDKNSYIYDKQTDTATYYETGILMEQEAVKQSFVSTENTIDGIYIKVSIVGNVENVALHYGILELDSNMLTENTISAKELESNKFNKLKLPQITETMGKEFTLILWEENSDEQNGVSFYLVPGVQDEQTLYVKEHETQATLVMRILCHRFDVETFVVMLGMISFITIFMKILFRFFK